MTVEQTRALMQKSKLISEKMEQQQEELKKGGADAVPGGTFCGKVPPQCNLEPPNSGQYVQWVDSGGRGEGRGCGRGSLPMAILNPAGILVRNLSVDSVCVEGGVHMPPKMTWNPQILLVRTLNV